LQQTGGEGITALGATLQIGHGGKSRLRKLARHPPQKQTRRGVTKNLRGTWKNVRQSSCGGEVIR
jgi:hypothetical protein